MGSSPTAPIHENRRGSAKADVAQHQGAASRSTRCSTRHDDEPTHSHAPWWLWLLAFLPLFVVACDELGPDEAQAHTPNPIACDIAYADAPAGEKWKTREACRRMQARHRLAHQCRPPRPLLPVGIRVKRAPASVHQRSMLTRALNEGRRRHATAKAQLALVQAITQESNATNKPYGDADSVGILQLRGYHGTYTQRMVPEYSAGWFISGTQSVTQTGTAGQLAQRVQRSGYPGAYEQWSGEASRTLRAFLGRCPR